MSPQTKYLSTIILAAGLLVILVLFCVGFNNLAKEKENQEEEERRTWSVADMEGNEEFDF